MSMVPPNVCRHRVRRHHYCGRCENEPTLGICSRCGNRIKDFVPPGEGMTAGYYVADAWQKYARPNEVYICDACMWADPGYIEDYGRRPSVQGGR